MPLITERAITNEIAALERSIAGIKNSYNYSENPDALSVAMLPAVVHYIPSYECTLKAHHNVWMNEFAVRSIVFVAPRQSSGGQLKFLENQAIPFGQKWRDKFQTEANLTTLFTNLSATVKVFLTKGEYGVSELLSYASIDYLGWVMDFQIVEMIGS